MPTIVRTTATFAAGLAVALISVFVFHAWRADAAPGDADSTFVPITPCRLIDTRPAPDRVGPIGALGTADTRTITAHGTNGNCTIPVDAVGLSLNATAVGATAPTFITVWPEGALPTVSSLNPTPGAPPTPNAVNTDLSGTGTFDVYNLAGTVNLIIDVNGYYTSSTLQEIHQRLTALETAQPFAVSAFATGNTNLTTTATAYVTVSVTAPVAGHVTLNSTAIVTNDTDDGDTQCAISESTSIQTPNTSGESDQWFEAEGAADGGSVSGTRTFEIAAGANVDYVLACRESSGQGVIRARNITAIFTPA